MLGFPARSGSADRRLQGLIISLSPERERESEREFLSAYGNTVNVSFA